MVMIFQENKKLAGMDVQDRRRPVLVNLQAERVALVNWEDEDGIAVAIADELEALDYTVVPLNYHDEIPASVGFVFSYGPYGEFLGLPRRLASIPYSRRPIFIHWNTEGLPDLRIPAHIMRALGRMRTWLDSWGGSVFDRDWLAHRMLRFRYLGDYYLAHSSGWLDVFADSSAVYGQWHQKQGIPAIYAPWGATSRWYKNLHLERDIDVLWMGNRESRRRDRMLNQLQQELAPRGVSFYLADNIANPFIFDDERIRYLNRAKITLNLTRTWYDDNFSRFALAAPNRSLIVSEPMLPHCPEYVAGTHYVSTPFEQMADTIVHYLDNPAEREKIVENAYDLVTNRLRFGDSINKIMTAAESLLHARVSA